MWVGGCPLPNSRGAAPGRPALGPLPCDRRRQRPGESGDGPGARGNPGAGGGRRAPRGGVRAPRVTPSRGGSPPAANVPGHRLATAQLQPPERSCRRRGCRPGVAGAHSPVRPRPRAPAPPRARRGTGASGHLLLRCWRALPSGRRGVPWHFFGFTAALATSGEGGEAADFCRRRESLFHAAVPPNRFYVRSS